MAGTSAMASTATTPFPYTFLGTASQNSRRGFGSSVVFNLDSTRAPVRCSAKKKKQISLADQILDYIEGGPKLRRWYGAPELLPEDESNEEEEGDFPEKEEDRDAVLVTDGDSEMGQMIILSLIVKRARIKALVKDKRTAMEAFGTYVESITGDASEKLFLKKALRGVRSVICPNCELELNTNVFVTKIRALKEYTFLAEGFLSKAGVLKGVKHVILLSQLSAYRGAGGIQALLKSNATKLAEQDESELMATGIPYTIIRAGTLQNSPGGEQGFSFEKGSVTKGSLSKEDAAFICVEALDAVPQTGFMFEVVNGGEKVTDWKECLARLMEEAAAGQLQ